MPIYKDVVKVVDDNTLSNSIKTARDIGLFLEKSLDIQKNFIIIVFMIYNLHSTWNLWPPQGGF